jgi:ABC-type glycerol-3-phosphate transport system substrate-binding protein
MSEPRLTIADRKRWRDEAIIDFLHGFINRREFMRRATAAGVSAVFAAKIANAVAAPAPAPQRSRWAKQADTTITIIKGPHHPDDAKFWDAMKQEFEAAHPDITLNPTFFNWPTMDAELTAGYAGEPPDVVYLVDLVLAKFVNAGQVADITAMVDTGDYAAEKAAIAPFTWDVTSFDGKTYGVGALGAASKRPESPNFRRPATNLSKQRRRSRRIRSGDSSFATHSPTTRTGTGCHTSITTMPTS